ncbi:MAG: Cation transport ATPase, partial [Parcubacteria group bacterium GW2011_GWC2_39_11]
MEKTILKISGMSCASCAANIENDLKKEEGIKSVNVNFATEKAYLEFDPIEISVARIQKIIEKLGYKILAEGEALDSSHLLGIKTTEENYKKEKEGEIKKLKNQFAATLLFSLP